MLNETTIYQQGGAITSFQSTVFLYGTCILMYNDAENGGAIFATESKWFVYGKLLTANNTASVSGGGVYLYQSELNCKICCTTKILSNSAAKKGGGIHAISSHIKVDDPASSFHIIANNAALGGGVCLEMNAKLYVLRTAIMKECCYSVLFSTNLANYGSRSNICG